MVDLFRECGEQYNGIQELLSGFANEDLSFISPSSSNKLMEMKNMFDEEDFFGDEEEECTPKKKLRVKK